MKTFVIFLWLSLYILKAHSDTLDDGVGFLQSESDTSILSEHGMDNKLPISERINLLFVASYCGQSNQVAQLVEGGVPVNSTNSAGMTPLMWLAQGIRINRYEDFEVGIAKYLISHGARIELKDKNGRMAADYAFEYGRYKLLPVLDGTGKFKFYSEKASIHQAQDQLAQTIWDLVEESAMCGGNFPPKAYDKVKIISDALRAGANPDQDIFLAALGGGSSEDYWLPFGQIMPEAIFELIRSGAKVNDPLSNGLQPLFYGVSKPTVFKMLLSAGADPRKVSNVKWLLSDRKSGMKFKFFKEPIVCEAAEFGVPETLQMLLERGVSIEERDARGSTPLHRAIDFANVETINFLLIHHASLQATNSEGQNALDMVATRMNVDFVRTTDKDGKYHKILEDYPGDPKSPVVGKWSQESDRANLFLRLDSKGGGEVNHYWKKPLAWKMSSNVVEILVYCPVIPRMPGDELEPGRLDYFAGSDVCVLHWRDGPQPSAIKLVRMK